MVFIKNTKQHFLGDIPPRRWEYSACIYRNKLYIFGGTMDRTHYNDFYSFDFETSKWTELGGGRNGVNAPPPRRRHKAVVYQRKMYIFGGREEPASIRTQPLPQDLRIYDFKNGTWSRISYADSGSSISIPAALNHSLYLDKQSGLLYVFGCQDAPVVKYNFKLNRWYPVSSRNYERNGLSLCTTHHGNICYWNKNLYIFGGQSRNKIVQGHVFKFVLDPQPEYAKDMLKMLNNKNVSDIQFEITRDNSIVYAHKCVLMARCQYFNKMFMGNFAESKEENLIIKIDVCSRKVFKNVLKFFYANELWIPNNINNTLEMLTLADLYQLNEMRHHCCEILQNSVNIGNAILLLQASRKFNLKDLRDLCKDFILANFAIYQKQLNLMTDLIELIQISTRKKIEQQNKNDKQEEDEEDEDDGDDDYDDDDDGDGDDGVDNDNDSNKTEENQWKLLHQEIMNAMAHRFGISNRELLSERQKRLKVNKLTEKAKQEYKTTHKEMIFAAKHGCKNLISSKSITNEITTLDDDEEEEDDDDDDINAINNLNYFNNNNNNNNDNDEDDNNDDEQKQDEDYYEDDDDDDSDDEDDYDDDNNDNSNSNSNIGGTSSPPPRKRRRFNNGNNNNTLVSSFNMNTNVINEFFNNHNNHNLNRNHNHNNNNNNNNHNHNHNDTNFFNLADEIDINPPVQSSHQMLLINQQPAANSPNFVDDSNHQDLPYLLGDALSQNQPQ